MLENSNPSNNSPMSTRHASPTTTCINNNASFATQLLNEFNAQQECHILVSLASSVQYVPSSPTLSMQEVASPPPLHVCINPNPNAPHPSMSPSIAKMILCMDQGDDLQTTAHAIAYSLITPYADGQPLPTSTSKRLTTISTNSTGLCNNERPKFTASKPGAETSTCPLPTSRTEGRWTYKCPPRVRRML